jgi:hypothetical protein
MTPLIVLRPSSTRCFALLFAALPAALTAAAPKIAPIPKGVPPGVWVRDGYRLTVAVEDLKIARFLALGPDGTLYVSVPREGRIVACRDRDGDGTYEQRTDFVAGRDPATILQGVQWHDGWLWFAQLNAISKARDTNGDGKADEVVEVIGADRLPTGARGGHSWRALLLHGGRIGLRRHHHELIAPQASHQMVGLHELPQPGGEGNEQAIAHRVAVSVIDDLEAIEIDQGQRQRLATQAGGGDATSEEGIKTATVGKFGEGIEQGKPFGPLTFEGIEEQAQEAAHRLDPLDLLVAEGAASHQGDGEHGR